MELDFTARPTSTSAASIPPVVPEEPILPAPQAPEIAALVERGVTLIGEVLGEIVSDTLENILERQEMQLVALLEYQDARLAGLLETQARAHAAELAALAEANAENLRTILREVLGERPSPPAPRPVEDSPPLPAMTPEVVTDLQETLRLGFGEIRGGLNQHHNEFMMVVRSELRPLAQAALAWLVTQTSGPVAAPAVQTTGAANPQVMCKDPHPDSSTSNPPRPAAPPRAPPPQRDLAITAAQRQHIHLAIAETDDQDPLDGDSDGHESTPLRYRAPDDRGSHMPEASP